MKQKTTTINLEEVQLQVNGDLPKFLEGSNACAAIEAKCIYISNGKWHVKAKDLTVLTVTEISIKLSTNNLSIELLKKTNSSVNDPSWINFCQKFQSLFDKYHKRVDKPNIHHKNSKDSNVLVTRNVNHVKSKVSKRGSFGKSGKTSKLNFLTMPWDDDILEKDFPTYQNKRENIEDIVEDSAPRKFKDIPSKEHSNDSDNDAEFTEEPTDLIRQTSATKKMIISSLRLLKKFPPGLTVKGNKITSDDDTDDENIFDGVGMTTPIAHNIVSPGGTSGSVITKEHATFNENDSESEIDVTKPQESLQFTDSTVELNATQLDDDSKLKKEGSESVPAFRNQRSISSFFVAKANKESTKPVIESKSIVQRDESQSSTLPETPDRIEPKILTNTADVTVTRSVKKRPLQSQDSWLYRSPARLPSSEKRQKEILFGKIDSLPVSVQQPLNTEVDNNQQPLNINVDDDKFDESKPSTPIRRVIKRARLKDTSVNDTVAEKTQSGTKLSPRPKCSANALDTFYHSPTTNKLSPVQYEKTVTSVVQPKHLYRGIRNLGNTCYLSASLQMLSTCQNFLTRLRGMGGALTQSIVRVTSSINPDQQANGASSSNYPQQRSVNPVEVKKAMDHKTNKFVGFEQRDAHEFLNDLIDHVHEEIEYKTEDVKSPQRMDVTSGSKNPTDDFCLTVQVCLKCKSCGYSRNKNEIYRNLSIDVIGDKSKESEPEESTVVSIERGLEHFFQPEIREIKCEKCEDGTHAYQTIRIVSRPKLLLLHLKRFLFVEKPSLSSNDNVENVSPNSPAKPPVIEYVLQKNRSPVSIPKSLSLSNFERSDHDRNATPGSPTLSSTPYVLKSIVHHIGSRASSGHYTADAIRHIHPVDNDNNTEFSNPINDVLRNTPPPLVDDHNSFEQGWVSFDDGIACPTTVDKILNNKKKQASAYMILYSCED